jgi:CRP-like cAMP-binding protein
LDKLFAYFRRFETLSADAIKNIATACKHLKAEKNTTLQPIGHSCKTIYFLEKGMARIFYFKEHVDITESFSFENQLVVRYESLFTGKPSKKGIELLEDADIIAIDAAQLFKLFDKHPDIERSFRKITETALVEQINRIESLQFHTAEERYKSLLSESPDILKRVPLKHIASYLGITPVSLSRIRASI